MSCKIHIALGAVALACAVTIGAPVDAASGKAGVNIGYTKGGMIIWNVVAPSSDMKPGAVEGRYGGVSAQATVGVGLGANVLLGGFDKSIALRPISIEDNTGANVAAGIGAIDLKFDKS